MRSARRLVDPYESDNGPNFGPAEYDGGNSLHEGGIAWWGNYLYVADTTKGVRIYDMSRIFRPPTSTTAFASGSAPAAATHTDTATPCPASRAIG